MKVVNLSARQFDHYALNHKYRNYYQSSNYANLVNKFGYKTEYIGIIDEDKKLIGASLIMYKEVFMSNKIAYAPRGILFDYTNPELLKELVEELKKTLGKRGFMLLRIDPYIPKSIRNGKGDILNIDQSTENIVSNLEQAGFTYKGETLYFEGEKPRWEGLVLLNSDIREIFDKFDKRVKTKIRKASSSGIIITKDENKSIRDLYPFIHNKDHKSISFYETLINNYKDNIDVYYAKINTETFNINSRRTYEKETDNNAYLSEIIQDQNLSPDEREDYLNKKMTSDSNVLEYKNNMILSTKLLKDYPNGLPIGGAIVIKYDNAAYVFIDGIDNKYSNLNASYLLKWQMIEDYHKEKLKYINLNGVTGDFTSNNKYKGVNDTKLGFNTIITEYVGEFDIILNSFNYKLYTNLNKK